MLRAHKLHLIHSMVTVELLMYSEVGVFIRTHRSDAKGEMASSRRNNKHLVHWFDAANVIFQSDS